VRYVLWIEIVHHLDADVGLYIQLQKHLLFSE